MLIDLNNSNILDYSNQKKDQKVSFIKLPVKVLVKVILIAVIYQIRVKNPNIFNKDYIPNVVSISIQLTKGFELIGLCFIRF